MEAVPNGGTACICGVVGNQHTLSVPVVTNYYQFLANILMLWERSLPAFVSVLSVSYSQPPGRPSW